MSPRWYDKRTGDYLALDTGGGPIARFWATALAGLVDIGYIKATGHSVKIYLPKTVLQAGSRVRVEDSEVEQRHRTRSRPHLFPGLRRGGRAVLRRAGARRNCTPAGPRTWTDFKVPDEAIGCGFHEAVRGVLSHHVVIRDGKIANYHPYPPTPWNANPRDIVRHARTLRGRRAEHADLRGERAGQIQGHRHHARRAQLRSLPAVRRAHVSRRGQDARDASFADVRGTTVKCLRVGDTDSMPAKQRFNGGSNRSKS